MLVRAAPAGRGARFFGRPWGHLLLVGRSLVVPQVHRRHLLRLRAQGAARAVAGRASDRGLQAGSNGLPPLCPAMLLAVNPRQSCLCKRFH